MLYSTDNGLTWTHLDGALLIHTKQEDVNTGQPLTLEVEIGDLGIDSHLLDPANPTRCLTGHWQPHDHLVKTMLENLE